MRVLAIDPGTTESGVILWDGEKIIEGGHVDNAQVLNIIAAFIENKHVDHVAIEMVASYGMAVGKSVFETVVWTGRFIQKSHNLATPWHQVYRKDVKMHLCHSMRAKDTNINQALRDRFGEKSTKANPNPAYGDVKMNNHTWAALALAVTFHDTYK